MRFSDLLAPYSAVQWGKDSSLPSRSVSSICFDSRKLEKDCVFVAIRGGKVDGHSFLEEAMKKGVGALVVEDASKVPIAYANAWIEVGSTRQALNQLASRYFGEPSRKLFSVGVTGTNGKTTTTHVIEALLNHSGLATGVIGTIDHHFGKKIWKTEMTTPDPVSFQERLSQFVQEGAKALSMEVSSHALHQSRVDEVPFDVAVFTNLTRDHLDYHSDMDDYFAAKRRLFTELLARSEKSQRTAIVNGDDEYGRRLLNDIGTKSRKWSYGAGASHDLGFEVLEQGFGGTRFRLKTPIGSGEFLVRMPGLHNVYNASAAIGSAIAAGASLETCAEALDQFGGVKGRLEAVPNSKGVHVFVDYAHSDDAITTILHYLGGIRKAAGLQNRLITVFGCGGDRDRGKRPLMMKASSRGSDVVVLTSDNPRTEDPERILDDALAGAESSDLGKRIFREVDRRKGIAMALGLAKPGDVVVVAGKGHEEYQIIGTTRYPFSDVEVVKEILK